MSARELHDAYERLAPQFGYETRADTKVFDPESPNGRLMQAAIDEVFGRAIALLAAVEESDGLVRELRDCFLCTSEKYEPRLHFVLDKAAARIVALEASISAERANGERERGIRDQHITRLESELASVKRLYDCGIRAFKELDSLLAQVLAAQSELASASRQAAARIDEQVAELASVKAERDRLNSAVRWALGYNEGEPQFQPRAEGDPPYWWRNELMRRAAHPKEGT